MPLQCHTKIRLCPIILYSGPSYSPSNKEWKQNCSGGVYCSWTYTASKHKHITFHLKNERPGSMPNLKDRMWHHVGTFPQPRGQAIFCSMGVHQDTPSAKLNIIERRSTVSSLSLYTNRDWPSTGRKLIASSSGLRQLARFSKLNLNLNLSASISFPIPNGRLLGLEEVCFETLVHMVLGLGVLLEYWWNERRATPEQTENLYMPYISMGV